MKSYYFEIKTIDNKLHKYVAQGKNKRFTYELDISNIKTVEYSVY